MNKTGKSEFSKRSVAILGSTGNIGQQTLQVIRSDPDAFTVEILAAERQVDLLAKQAREFMPNAVIIGCEDLHSALAKELKDLPVKVWAGSKALEQVMEMDSFEIVVMAMAGFAALSPTLSALRNKKQVALANKECLVAGGELLLRTAQQYRGRIIPVDSEHSAIFQCLVGEGNNEISKITLTASGGPFLNYSSEHFNQITPAMALKHPTWNMGAKVTVDSASLMNKGMEAIGAHWLFGVSPDQIEVLIHQQSIVHSLVHFADGAVKAQLGIPDMHLPIQYALTYPQRLVTMVPALDLSKVGTLTFETPDVKKFRNLALAFEALHTGGSLPGVLNAANEVAVTAFLREKISFQTIPEVVESTMQAHETKQIQTLESLLETDQWARNYAAEIVKRY